MGQYILKRLLLMIPTLIGITLVTFLIIRLAPGDPVAAKFGTAADMQSGGEGGSQGDKASQILNAKVRLGLMQKSGMVRAWDLEGDTELLEFVAHEGDLLALAAGPDGSFASGGASTSERPESPVHLWNRDGRQQGVLHGARGGVSDLAFSPDGDRLAAVALDGHLRVYDLESGATEPSIDIKAHERVIRAVAYGPDERIATGSGDHTVRLWDGTTGELLATLEGHFLEVTSVAFTAGGLLISGSRDRTVRIWDPEDGRLVHEIEKTGAEVLSLAVSPDDALLAVGLGANLIRLYDLVSRKPVQRLEGHTGPVASVAFSPDAGWLASGSLDGTVRIWQRTQEGFVAVGSRPVSSGGSARAVDFSSFAGAPRVLAGAPDIHDVPLINAYLGWLRRLIQLDLGTSIKHGRPVKDIILEALPVTLKLNLISIFLTYLFSIPLGVYAGAHRNGSFDQSSSLVVFLLYSMPSFWVATMLLLLFATKGEFSDEYLGFLLPATNLHSANADDMPYMRYTLDHWLHLILPLIALTYSSFAFLSRLARNNMLDVLSQDYVRTARAKGLPESRVIGVHAFRNSLISIVTIVGNLLPALIGGSVIIEQIFSIPGMGLRGFDAILARDYPLVMAITTFVAILTMLGILLSDILYCIVDPRIQLQ